MTVVEKFQRQAHVRDALGLIQKKQIVARHQTIEAPGIPGGQEFGHDRIIPSDFQGLEGQFSQQSPGKGGLPHLARSKEQHDLSTFLQPVAQGWVDFAVQKHDIPFYLANTIAQLWLI